MLLTQLKQGFVIFSYFSPFSIAFKVVGQMVEVKTCVRIRWSCMICAEYLSKTVRETSKLCSRYAASQINWLCQTCFHDHPGSPPLWSHGTIYSGLRSLPSGWFRCCTVRLTVHTTLSNINDKIHKFGRVSWKWGLRIRGDFPLADTPGDGLHIQWPLLFFVILVFLVPCYGTSQVMVRKFLSLFSENVPHLNIFISLSLLPMETTF